MTADAFSIITASYNNARYLSDWYFSILVQKYRPLNVVLVDDCSTDKTKDLIPEFEKGFAKNDISFKFISNDVRRYCATSYKIATLAANTPFYGVLDSDDKITSDAVEYVMGLYQKYQDVAWIYTQFERYNDTMRKRRGEGLCKAPPSSGSLMHYGFKRIHAYSHWRTFSNRIPEIPMSIWKDGMRSAVDKYMGYRLEELGQGLFADRVCYMYRHPVKGAISKTEPATRVWIDVLNEAAARRKRMRIRAIPIRTLS